MTIFVKEIPGVFSINNVTLWIKKEHDIRIYKSIDDVSSNDCLIISNKDQNIENELNSSISIYVYEDFKENILLNTSNEYEYARDYYHLNDALKKA